MTTPIDFDGINAAALHNGRSFVESLLPGGKFRSHEYVVKNPCRDDRRPGSFSINYRSGRWKDFSSGDGGSDLVSLVAYLRGTGQGDAAREMADKLGIAVSKSIAASKLNRSGGNGTSHAAEAPKVYPWGNEGPQVQPDEIRRHPYSCSGFAMRIKIKLRKNDNPYVQCFRVFSNGIPIGWQWKQPDDYTAIPYVSPALDPFDSELIADDILWPEGEKDVDTLNKLNLPAFTFGGVGDGLPDNIGHYLKDRRLVILADNDTAGREHADKKTALAYEAGAASIKVVHFLELPPKGDVSDFLDGGGTVEQLTARIDAAPMWSPSSVEAAPVPSGNILELIVKRASEIVPQPVMWLWPGRMAIGKQTLIAGEPGLGKSQIATALAAAVTTGGAWPHEEGRAPLGNAIILSAEDGIADTIVPRLHAAQADCERAFIISAVRNNDRLRTFNLQADLALLEQTIDRIGDVRLVVIDPISSYMGAIDSHKNTDVRAVLEAVGEMAERRHIAIVGITHFTKGAGQRAINAFMGSVAFIAAARAAFAVMKDSSDETRHLFLPVKNNLAPLGLGLAFRLVQHLIPGADGCGPASAVSWESSPVTSTADEMMAANSGSATLHTAKADCIEFLEAILASGWVEVADITAEAVGAGLHAEGKQLKDNKPMRDARAVLKVETHRDGFGKGARYFWALPGTPWAPSDPMGALSYERAPMDEEGRP
jgi:hypothetical protein